MAPQLRQTFALHLRMQNGSTMGYKLIDHEGKEVGAVSHYTPRGKKGGQARSTYTLFGDPPFAAETPRQLLDEWERRHGKN